MVKLFLTIIAFCLAYGAQAEYSVDQLRSMFHKNAKDQQTASQRLKASRKDASQIKLLKEDEIKYKLPSGRYVLGMVLPNGKISPAIQSDGKKFPACVTVDERMFKGKWDARRGRIVCDLSQSKLAEIQGQVSAEELSVSSNRYSKPKSTASKSYNSKPAPKTPKVDPNIYVPPARTSSTVKSIGAVLDDDSQKYGISIGTWAECRLERSISSSESGLVEFSLTESIQGRYDTIPAGTVLFANKGINVSDKRLEASLRTALLPDGSEIEISGYIYDRSKRAGLSGELIRDIEGEQKAASSKALLSGISAAVPTVGGNVAGAVAESYTSDAIRNEQRYLPNNPKATIRVSPQNCLIKIAKTF